MSIENEWTKKEEAQDIIIKQLEEKNSELVIRLHDASTEVASLKLEVEKLQDGQIALTVKLQDADKEIGRLSLIIKNHK